MAETKKAKGYSKSITEVDSLWHAYFYHDDEEFSLGTFPTELAAERATEDAIARHIYAAENQAADDKVRAEQAKAEEDRIKADNERQTTARAVVAHK